MFDSGQFKSAVVLEHLCGMKLYAFESGENQFYEISSYSTSKRLDSSL